MSLYTDSMAAFKELTKKEPLWTQEDALLFCMKLWPIAKQYGWYIGLTGSCLYRGDSFKDMDLVAYQHVGHTRQPLGALHSALKTLGMELVRDFDTTYGEMHVEVWKTRDGKRIDVLIPEAE